MAVYCATKAYVLSYTRALHAELKKTGVSVTAYVRASLRPVSKKLLEWNWAPLNYLGQYLRQR